MHSTPDARFAWVCLLTLAGILALSRRSELRAPPALARQDLPQPVAPREHVATSGEGDRLRDGRRIDPNRATSAELELLPGVGPRLASEILRVRSERGPFRQADDLLRVRGIGDKKLAKLSPLLIFASEGLEHTAEPD